MKNHRLAVLAAACLLVSGIPTRAQEGLLTGDAIVGEWLTPDQKARVQIYRDGDTYCGKIVWLKEPTKEGKPVVDDKNPDERLRAQPVLGLQIMRDFAFDGEDEWSGGKIYDPENGNDYSGKITLADPSTMELRGYVLIPLFGRSETWKRVVQ